MPRVLALITALSLSAGRVLAQEDCFPSDDSNEAQVFAAYSVPLAFGLAEAPRTLQGGAVRLGLEATYLPDIDEDIRAPTTCRPGKGPENTNMLPGFLRPRVEVGLSGGFTLEASWVPPVRVSGVKANLLSFALRREFGLGSSSTLLALRLHGVVGLIQAPITCDEDALQDPTSECFNGTLSDDKYHPNIFGVEGTFSWDLGGGKVRPFVGGGVNFLYPRFQVNFTNQFGQLDERKVEVDLIRGAMLAGATWAASSRTGLTGQIYAWPGDAITGRVVVSYGLGAGSEP